MKAAVMEAIDKIVVREVPQPKVEPGDFCFESRRVQYVDQMFGPFGTGAVMSNLPGFSGMKLSGWFLRSGVEFPDIKLEIRLLSHQP